jgi:hypothetical protein
MTRKTEHLMKQTLQLLENHLKLITLIDLKKSI